MHVTPCARRAQGGGGYGLAGFGIGQSRTLSTRVRVGASGKYVGIAGAGYRCVGAAEDGYIYAGTVGD